MHSLVKYLGYVVGALVLAGCVAGGTKPSGADLLPMYGGIDRQADTKLRATDEKFIAKATKEYGDRRRASQAYVEQGVRHFLAGDAAATMMNFNRAWLLDPGNPDPYWGYAVVSVDQGRHCDARAMIDRALERSLSKPAYIADAGRIYTLCAAGDAALSASQRRLAFEQAEEFFSRAASMAPTDEYIYGTWAVAHYRQGHYADAWRMVKRQRALGGTPDASFLSLLRAKMPEPK